MITIPKPEVTIFTIPNVEDEITKLQKLDNLYEINKKTREEFSDMYINHYMPYFIELSKLYEHMPSREMKIEFSKNGYTYIATFSRNIFGIFNTLIIEKFSQNNWFYSLPMIRNFASLPKRLISEKVFSINKNSPTSKFKLDITFGEPEGLILFSEAWYAGLADEVYKKFIGILYK